jgi:probable rRNA maturation factor
MTRDTPARLEVDAVVEGGDWSAAGDLDALVADTAAAVAAEPGLAGKARGTAAVAFDTDAAVRRLNATFRKQDKPTNVLSFPAGPVPAHPDGERHLGDVVLAAETVAREAAEAALPLRHHVCHLVVHGLLHLMGYDHESEADAAAMEGLEIAILARLGIADPYAAAERALP